MVDYHKDMKIDPDALDIECLEHSIKALEYIELAVKLRKEERYADERVKTKRSELIEQANEDPEGCCNKAKPNMNDIEAYWRNHPDYIELKDKWIEAAAEADFADLAQKEFSYGRKKALENLVVLYGQSYFAGPKTPRDLGKEVEKRKEVYRNKKPIRRKK